LGRTAVIRVCRRDLRDEKEPAVQEELGRPRKQQVQNLSREELGTG
jgi:hypothetical protein